jgi:rhodanese-related sulfurtransferase
MEILENWWVIPVLITTLWIIIKYSGTKKRKIIDVRTASEFKAGNIKNSINIPLSDLNKRISDFNQKEDKIITVCAAGVRAESAKKIFKEKGFEVENGGRWSSLKGIV